MGDDFWKPTAEAFQQLFSKPKMTEKLLSRPPFRYVHDIFTATMGATGFGEGLYSEEELDAKSIKDKDSKINFLEKLIALVQMAAGEEIPVKSTKIVAGQEAEQTNVFLQYLFKVATSGIDSAPIVAQILGEGEEEQEPQAQEEDDGADEEEAARQAAEEEEQRKREKRAAKKRAMEEEKLRKQEEEEEERQRIEQEQAEKQRRIKEKAEAEAQKKLAKKSRKREEPEEPQQPPPQPAIIEEGQDDDDDQNVVEEEDNNDVNAGIDINEVDPESKFGRKAMAQLRAQEEEEQQETQENAAGGGGIKMGKIGGRRGRKKAGGVERSEPQKKTLQQEAPQRSYGGYNEDDIEFMRKSIQALCQSTNPLGKSIDFVTEDIDSMVKEYEHWKIDYAESIRKLEEQQRVTEQTIQPLQDVTLAQLEERIREEKSKIQNIRSQIIRNDNTIQNLLQSVISSG